MEENSMSVCARGHEPPCDGSHGLTEVIMCTILHPATHHKSVRPTILTAVNDPEYRKLFNSKPSGNNKEQLKTQGTPTKTSVTRNSFVKNLFQTPKFQNMIAARSA